MEPRNDPSRFFPPPRITQIRIRTTVNRHRGGHSIREGRSQPHVVLEANRLASCLTRRALEEHVVETAQISPDRSGLRVREAAAVGNVAPEFLLLAVVLDSLLDREGARRTSRRRHCLVHAVFDLLVGRGAFNSTTRSDWAVGHIPLKGPLPGKIR